MVRNSPACFFIHASIAGSRSRAPLNRSRSAFIEARLSGGWAASRSAHFEDIRLPGLTGYAILHAEIQLRSFGCCGGAGDAPSRRCQRVGISGELSSLAVTLRTGSAGLKGEPRYAGFTTPTAPPTSEDSSSSSPAKQAHEQLQRRSDDENSQKHNEGDFACSALGDGAGERFPAGAVSGGRRDLFQNGAGRSVPNE